MKPSRIEEILKEEENSQTQGFSTDNLRIIEHPAFHPTAPILVSSTSLSTIHLYDLESKAFTPNFLCPASANERG